MATNASTQSGSKRWTHFHSALQLAIQRVSHKWTYEDFTECFPQYCEKQPEVSSSLHTTLARHMEAQISAAADELLAEYNAKEKIDILHAVVTEARARRHMGGGEAKRKDLWREDLQPRQAVRARTIPVLEQEVERLRRTLRDLEERNLRLQGQLEANVRARKKADDQVSQLLDIVDRIYAEWNKLPMEQIQEWTLQTAEITSAARPR
ncbi:hypothetical protein GLOTRDRAFT_75457 [Gloeophyllum trabeum ATCC 11539]|uniref:Nnf1-domain-containing protein n=1 Tax=Gloeophyllum trabeum (strain ATCC 11539 / FP-39264 / Madison 617) TaxID=670483 RepID=S7RPZ2_GLOTA|nr:uncharacterized protein GLOTRDRAFT_75457 [Gloeophyllum trabeum ATCC 11539]EPQ56650.1 hypothetical protein GLOTRDRAFT_75457 [Gloeophyllum trabeum ATCC 11539]